ncbi:MAG: hypothetical protein LC121_10965 [Anaerolineae bacterium]|nr:hypothetical protein [Anaerolineae bacterium]
MLLDWTARLRSDERNDATDDNLARRVMRDFVLRQWYGLPQSTVTLEWIAEAFDAMLDGAKPQDALRLLSRSAHRPRDPGRTTGADVAQWLRATELRGYGRAEAVGLASERFSRDTKTIERYRRDYAAEADGMVEGFDFESLFLSMGRPLPPRRTK